MRYAWIAEHGKSFALPEGCEVLEVSGSGYQAWKCGGIADRKRLADAKMRALIRAIHAEKKVPMEAPARFGNCGREARPASQLHADGAKSDLSIRHYLPVD
ncbi:MAG TPA: hypothetical protein DCQ77_11765 [Betaproteobacteria bacterium]|nr:hypothetical protein [Betaproteobacteria bacterium]